MKIKIVLMVALMAAASTAAHAQGRVEIAPFFGYTLSEGSDFNAQLVNGNLVDQLTPQSGMSYGVQVDYVDRSGWAGGFQFAEERSKLEVGFQGVGAGSQVVTDMSVKNYHGIFTYNVGRDGDTVRPYAFFGLGATHYSFDPIQGNPVDGATKFSATWGAGVKVYATEHVGFRASGRWTPTYINSEAAGIYCSPYWIGSCWVVGDPNYAHQFETSGGVIFTF